MRCAVHGCDSFNMCRKIRFFCFPKDAELLKKWVAFCNQNRVINTKNERICIKHFLPDDLERSIQYEMGLCSRPGKLKPGTIPSVHPSSKTDHDLTETSSDSMDPALRKEIIQSLLEESYSAVITPCSIDTDKENGSDAVTISTTHSEHSTVQHSRVPPLDHGAAVKPQSIIFKDNASSKEHEDKIKYLQEEISRLQSENSTIKKENIAKCKEINALELERNKADFHRNNMEKKLSIIFTTDQINNLKKGLEIIEDEGYCILDNIILQ